MRKIAIAAAVSLSLSGVTGVSHALGLGEIEMYSALNQSLDAEIEILSATEDELRDLRVQLASSDAFARAGLEQLPVLSSVVFAVDRRPDGKAVVKVTSDGPVLEPFLNFLIEVDAPGSVKLVREYTVLLNPTTLADSGTSTSGSTTVTDFNPTIGSGVADSGGVQIDLTDAVGVGAATTAAVVVAESFADNDITGNDIGSEVSFTESSAGTFTVADAGTSTSDSVTAEPDNLFVPDEEVFANSASGSAVSASGSTLLDSGGQVISLEQELNLTPQFDDGVIGSADAIDLTAEGGETIDLDNLGAQGGTTVADNAIFGSEFDSTADGELIAGEELRTLVGTDLASSVPTVEFTETVVPIQSFESIAAAASEQIANAELASAELASAEVADADIADSDAAGDLIDLSGIIDEVSPAAEEVVQTRSTASTSSARNQPVETSGNTYRIQSSDTLWRIANAQKARATTPHQMMVALLDANPAAFVNGNMNRLRSGAVLQIPTVASQTLIEPASALAIVRSWTRDNKPPVRNLNSGSTFVEPVIVTNDTLPEAEIVITDSANDLESINQRYEQVRDELAEETMQRDDLQGRVEGLTDNMEEMKTLITVRENDLATLESEVASAESDAAALDAQISNLSDASNSVAELQQGLNRDLADAQDEIKRQADLDKNLADAEAQAQSVRLSSEEDSLRTQLAALQIEKRDLEATAQDEKAALVREAEAEKKRLLAQARNERERIMSELEDEKARIGIEAEAKIARIRGEAVEENQRVLNEAQLESERLKAETAQMEAKLAEVEAQKMALEEADAARIAAEEQEQIRLDKIAMEEAEQAAAVQAAATDADTDAAGMVDKATDSGKSMLADGTAAAGGLLGVAPLQEMIGNRKNILAAGAGLSLVGLLAAWGLRRRRHTNEGVEKPLRPRADVRPATPALSGTSYEQEQAMYGDDNAGSPVQQRTGNNSGAAAAAAAAAAVTGTAGVAATRTRSEMQADAKSAPVPEAPPAPAAPAELSAEEEELEAVALDDTITEAEVYLRYGLHGQAEDLLKTAIERAPDNEEYHFKLLENYHDQKNLDGFKETASSFTEKFPASGHAARIAEMDAELNGKPPGAAGGAGAIAAGVAGAGAVAAGALTNAKDAAADGIDSAMGSVESGTEDLLDQTIDPGSEFSVDELQATGDLGAMVDDAADLGDTGGMALDDVDIAALDDDGTMNLEEIAGSQMSGGDLGSMDFTNPDVDGALDNLNVEDAELNSPGGVSGGISGAEPDLPLDSPIAGGTDEMETMLDLAKAYIDMGDDANASKALKDIAARGNPLQQTEANELLKKLK